MPEQSEPLLSPPRWLRFSLASLLWAVVLVSLLVTTVMMGIRLRRAEREVEKLRSELGQLTIQDPQKIHAIGIRSHDSLEFCWRIHLPPGRQFCIREAQNGIPMVGLPAESGTISVTGEGEAVLFAGVKRKSGEPAASYLQYEKGLGPSLGATLAPDWTKENSWSQDSHLVGPGSTVVFEPNQPAVLLRMRVKSGPGSVPTTPCEGLMVWIEPIPTTGGPPQLTTTWSATPAP